MLLLDHDRADQSIERRIRQVGSLGDRPLVHLGPQRLETLALGDAPAIEARGFRVLSADVDLDSADFQGSRAIDRQDSALRAFPLRD